MISILTALTMLAPVAHAQDCGVIDYDPTAEVLDSKKESSAEIVYIDDVGSKLQLNPADNCLQEDIEAERCTCECRWTLIDPDNGDGQAVGQLTEINDDGDEVTNNQTNGDINFIDAKRVWYTAPDDLNDCRDVEAEVRLDCSVGGLDATDPDDFIELVTTSPYLEPCSVSGGGCIAPQGTGVQEAGGWLLLPLLGLVIRRRELRD